MSSQNIIQQNTAQPPGFRFGGGTPQGVDFVGGHWGGAPPPDAEEFSKIFKIFLMKIAKNALF